MFHVTWIHIKLTLVDLVDPDDIQKIGAVCEPEVSPINVLNAAKTAKEYALKWTGYTGNIRHLRYYSQLALVSSNY